MQNMKFKIGDKVRCITQNIQRNYGAGWKENHIFTITNTTKTYDRNGEPLIIYWKSINDCGVFEFALEKVNMTQHQKLKSKMTGDSIS